MINNVGVMGVWLEILEVGFGQFKFFANPVCL